MVLFEELVDASSENEVGSGVSGVTRLEPRYQDCQETLGPAYWVARWPGEGKTIRQRRFSVTKYGEWGAYLKAVQAREHGLATMDDEPF
ncbi:MAG: AP2/ERF family transcription factor [Nitrospira sp.]